MHKIVLTQHQTGLEHRILQKISNKQKKEIAEISAQTPMRYRYFFVSIGVQ